MDQPEGSPNFIPVPAPVESAEPTSEQSIPNQAEAASAPEVSANKQVEKSPERGANINQKQAGVGSGVSLPAVQAPVVQPTSQQADDDNDDTPLIADDVDVIEMEWVNKAKEIIKNTRKDPHAQEQAVEKLQIDYLKKRYGKDVKSSRGS